MKKVTFASSKNRQFTAYQPSQATPRAEPTHQWLPNKSPLQYAVNIILFSLNLDLHLFILIQVVTSETSSSSLLSRKELEMEA